MSVEFVAPRLADVHHDDETYRVDLAGGACECPDYQHRGDEYVCKHLVRVSVVALFVETQLTTEFVARVARHVRSADGRCPFGVDGCHGPTAPADRPADHPCPGCVKAAGGNDWAVWQALHDRADRAEAR